MTDPQPSTAPPANPPRPAPPQRSMYGCLFGLSFMLNLFLLCLLGVFFIGALLVGGLSEEADQRLREKHHSGKSSASNKVAVIEIEGVIFEGAIEYAKRQIKQAKKDDDVKAVVVRINSPGGSITASDELHRRLTELIGTADKPAKPGVASMGALAASGGYYVAMPCKTIYAERTTITGSIGVFASFPNVKELSEKVGFKMETIKAGAVKDSGSPFKDMTPQERELWQGMVDHAYLQFLEVVREGRPDIKDDLQKVVVQKDMVIRDPKTGQERQEQFVRTRVDGGIFTADEAKKFELVDQIGYLDDAIKDAAKQAGLGEDYQAVTYEKPKTLSDLLLGVKSSSPGAQLTPQHLASAATPRLWYLSPQSELAGILTAAGK